MSENKKQDEKWESRNTDCEETVQLNDENPSIQGVYLGTKWVDGKFGLSALHMIRTKDGEGEEHVLGVWGYTSLNAGMETVCPNTKCRLTYKGEKDVGKGNPMQLADVQVPAGSPIRADRSFSRSRVRGNSRGDLGAPEYDGLLLSDDDVPF